MERGYLKLHEDVVDKLKNNKRLWRINWFTTLEDAILENINIL